ncbi:MASE3 domain-containing protein [Desulfospira joergensenii]|uniref:MASE3 domain-containing protein n=1 Tax=Desulfospira joergensenii TaxID=53329 RepID=UPI0003B760C0|nr:MASE3 domain-containing protein [Desulfospira joergensenii]
MGNSAAKSLDPFKKFEYLLLLSLLAGLYLTTHVNYLLFHTLSEFFSIVVAAAFFMITWNSKQYIKNQYLLFIGIAYLFIAFLDLLHTLSYKGMPVFTDYDYYANQLWIGARYMESITLVAAFYFLKQNKEYPPEVLFMGYLFLTGLVVASIFYWKIFPVCFVEGTGLTPFKKISEYIICLILVLGLFLLSKNKARFEPNIFQFLVLSMICTIISELAFTFYVSNYGFSNLVGHYFKLFSFYLIYKAIIESGIRRPYDLVFKELDTTNINLSREIEARVKSEKEREKLIVKLQKALIDVKTLSGLLPICAHCKNIRDDKGYWTQLESYLDHHADVRFSHGICPDCMKKYYPGYSGGSDE